MLPNDPRSSPHFFRRRLSRHDRTLDSFRRKLAFQLRAARGDCALQRGVLSEKIQIFGAAHYAFYFRRGHKFSLWRAVARPADSRALFRARGRWGPRSSLAVSCFAQDAFAGLDCWVNYFLCDDERVLLVERPRLRKKSGRTHSSAHRWPASVQRDAELDVFPQFTNQRSSIHSALCYFHELRPKR